MSLLERKSLLVSPEDLTHGGASKKWILDPALLQPPLKGLEDAIPGGSRRGSAWYAEVPGLEDTADEEGRKCALSEGEKGGDGGGEGEEGGKRSISALRLAMITYFFTSGGPTGCEAAVGAAGPFYSIIAFLIVPIIWCLPQALMSAELSLMMEQNGGNILWVRKAFGNFVGWMNTFNFLTYMMASMAIVVVLFTDYLPDDVKDALNFWQMTLVQLGFILILTGLNLWGIEWVSRLSGLFFLIIYTPFIVEAIAGPIMVDTDFAAVWKPQSFEDIEWTLFLSTTLWCYGAFDSIGSVAGEVEGGRNTFLKGIAYSLPVVMVNYFLPIVIGYAIVPHTDEWEAGFFTEVAYRVSDWLGIWLVVASEVGNFAQYNAGMVSVSRVLWACGKGPVETQMLPSFVAWSIKRKSGVILPVMGIFITAAATFGLSLLPFDVLVQFTMAVRIINLFCEYGALIMLKYTEPDTPRPFAVPGGKWGAILMAVPTVVLSVVLLVFADWALWVFTGGLNAAFLLGYFIRQGWIYLFCRQKEGHHDQTLKG